ncbi:Endogenous retrovirus group FC1 Env polyprotein [Plecturocebus cupreus]
MISGNPNPWAPLASASPVAPTCHPLTLQSVFLTALLISPLEANLYVWRVYIQESWVEGPTVRTHYIAQADCQPTGCQSVVIIEMEKTETKTLQVSSPTPGLCFLYDQKHDYCHWLNTTYGGCPYNSCEIHMPAECHETQNNCKDGKQLLKSTLEGKLFLTIRDPWDDHWDIEQLSSVSHTIPQNEATLTNQFKPSNSTSPPFSWLTLVQQEANLLNLTKTMNITKCFLCACLSNPPLAAVLLRFGFNLSQSPMGPGITLTDIPLFKTASSFGLNCNITVKIKSSLYAPLGGYFWCNRTLTKVINASLPFPCVPVTLVPQLEVHGQTKLLSLLPPSPNHRDR